MTSMYKALGSILKYQNKDSWEKPQACSTHLQKSRGHGERESFSLLRQDLSYMPRLGFISSFPASSKCWG